MFARLGEKPECKFVGLVSGAELDFDWFVAELGKCVVHFSIEDEGRVGVEFFLELEEMGLGTCPRARLIHGENEHIAAGVIGECIEHSRVCDPVGSQAFGYHW